MGALTKHDPIPVPDQRRPEMMPSWPEWLTSRVDAVRLVQQPDPTTGRYRSVMTLPKSSILSQSERTVIEAAAAKLKAQLSQTPESGTQILVDGRMVDCDEAMLVIITKMMKAKPAARTDEIGVEATGETYMIALEDMPVWAVTAALRKWYRGESPVLDPKHPHDYRWRPDTAALRKLAMIERAAVANRFTQLDSLLNAETLIEFSPEHEDMMRRAFGGLLRAIGQGAVKPGMTIEEAMAFAAPEPVQPAALPKPLDSVPPLQFVKIDDEAAA